MQYLLVRIFPYLPTAQAPELELLLREGWTLHGGPFSPRPDECFQAVTRPARRNETRGDVRLGEPGRITTG